jgi:thymidine phosphorylase
VPTIVDTYIKDGETINVYESGAHYNVTRKHLVKAPESAMLTSERSRELKEKFIEKKREAMVRGAGRALEKAQPGEWAVPNALDVVEALAEAATMKALNPDNPKQIDAARFIMTETGMSESQTKTSEDAQQFAPLGDAIAQLAAILKQIHSDGREIVDVPATDLPAITDTRNE